MRMMRGEWGADRLASRRVDSLGPHAPVSVAIGDEEIPADSWPAGQGPFGSVDVAIPMTFNPGIYPVRVTVDGLESTLRLEDDPLDLAFGQLVPQIRVTP